ncbi:MAG: tripartite tricarboxylate transporter substrate binding protein [Betaproteobacteria bacterium]|nr:tripartite tricarboxylate transporter substrate binding protein [Betaproteobacteria bacterium]
MKPIALPVAAAAFALGGAGVALHAYAADYPSKPVRIIVPFSPGGGTDIQARLLATAFNESMRQTFIVDNRTGASGLIGAQLAVDAPPDGYTILFTTASLSVNSTLFAKRMKFDMQKDLVPISWITSAPLVLSVHPNVPAKTVPELVALAKKKPGLLNNGVNTLGSTSHLSAEMLKQMAGVKTGIVPYRGGGPATVALVAGEIDMLFATAPSVMPHLKSGRVRAIAVTTAKKASALPDLPTMNTYYPEFESDNWYAMFFPAGTPKAMVDKVNSEIRKALETRGVSEFLAREGLDAVGSSPAELAALVKSEIPKYAQVIQRGHIAVK